MSDLKALIESINAQGGINLSHMTVEEAAAIFKTRLSDEQVRDILNRIDGATATIIDDRNKLATIVATLSTVAGIVWRVV